MSHDDLETGRSVHGASSNPILPCAVSRVDTALGTMSRWIMQTIEKPDGERQKPRTTTSFAILGLLSLRTWSTYELAKQVSRSLHWFWPRAERKLYDEPKVLVADGLATASKSYTGERPRTVYEITDAGRAALTAWLDEPPAARVIEFEAMLKIFFADAGSIAQLVTTIEAWRRAHANGSVNSPP